MALLSTSPRFVPAKDSSPGPGAHFSSPPVRRPDQLDLTNTSLTSQSIRRSPTAKPATVAHCSHCYGAFLFNVRRDVHTLTVRNRSLACRAQQVARQNTSARQSYLEGQHPLLLPEREKPVTVNSRALRHFYRERGHSAERCKVRF